MREPIAALNAKTPDLAAFRQRSEKSVSSQNSGDCAIAA
jgi:hypothetical protein